MLVTINDKSYNLLWTRFLSRRLISFLGSQRETSFVRLVLTKDGRLCGRITLPLHPFVRQ